VREVSVNDVGVNLHKLIEQVTVTREPVMILGRESNAVLISAGDWVAINETLDLLSVPGMRESIAEGMREGIGDCASKLDW
jgi:PHD/YefM family antitoxin component YafN of YafNO toxin-antitoxin module